MKNHLYLLDSAIKPHGYSKTLLGSLDFQNPQKIDLGQPCRGHFKVTTVKMVHIVSTVATRPMVPVDKNCHRCPFNKMHLDLYLDWPLGVTSMSRK